jgi:hypothetical protein
MGESGNQSFSTLRSLRAARPLRQLRSLRFLSMTVVILESLGLSRKVVTPVFSLALLIFAIFAILGIPLFRGLLSRECEAPILGGTETTCPDGLQCTDTEICVERKFVWTDASLRLTHNTQELVDPTVRPTKVQFRDMYEYALVEALTWLVVCRDSTIFFRQLPLCGLP